MHYHEGHNHGESYSHRNVLRRYWLVLIITASIFFAELFGGIISRSLALLSDSFHMLIDVLAVFVAVLTEFLVFKNKSLDKLIRGWGGILNGALLAVITISIFIEAIERIFNPPKILIGIMLIVASVGLIGNLISVYLVEFWHKHEENITHKALFLHVLSDAAQSLVVIIAGVVIWFTSWNIIDPILSIGIALVMSFWSCKILRESIRLLTIKN